MERLNQAVTKLLPRLYAYRLGLISGLVLFLFALTMLQVRTMGSGLTDNALLQQETEEAVDKIERFDETVITEVVKRTSPTDTLPAADITNNPFIYD